MKIVVVGLGKVGRALTQQLSADKHDIVVIDRNPTLSSILATQMPCRSRRSGA